MKNNRGFVVSAVLYPLLVLFLALIMGLISMSSTRKNILDNMKMEISDSIFDSVTCDCEVINSTLKKYGQSIKNIENDITEIENDITTINTTQNTLSTNLTNLTNRVTSLETNVNSLKSRMSTAESKITNIETNYATKTTTNLLDTKITNLTTTVNSINTSLTNLTNRVNTLVQQELTIYMSPSGNDSYDGLSSSKSMKTLNAVLNKYSNSSLTIIIESGTYNWGKVKIVNREIKMIPSKYQGLEGDTSGNITDRTNFDCLSYTGTCPIKINLDSLTTYNTVLRVYRMHFNITSDVQYDVFNNFSGSYYATNNRAVRYNEGYEINGSYPVYYGAMFENSSIYMYENCYIDTVYGVFVKNSSFKSEGGQIKQTYQFSRIALLADEGSYVYFNGSIYSTNTYVAGKENATVTCTGGSRVVISGNVYAANSSEYYAYNKNGTLIITGGHTGKKSGTVGTTY